MLYRYLKIALAFAVPVALYLRAKNVAVDHELNLSSAHLYNLDLK
jgi:hypothetical protein